MLYLRGPWRKPTLRIPGLYSSAWLLDSIGFPLSRRQAHRYKQVVSPKRCCCRGGDDRCRWWGSSWKRSPECGAQPGMWWRCLRNHRCGSQKPEAPCPLSWGTFHSGGIVSTFATVWWSWHLKMMSKVLGAGALGWPRGIGWGGRWEGGSGWGTHVNPWLIHVNVW